LKPCLPRRLFIDAQVAELPLVTTIRSRLNRPAEVVDNPDEVYQHIRSAADPVQAGKETLYLTRNKGSFLRNCPGTKNYTCCGYKILHIGTYCNLDCVYCILQSYFHPPVLQYFVNHEDLFSDLERLFAANRIQRIGTGEFTDSLIWEPWTLLSRELIPRFARQSKAVLELKTKTANIEDVVTLDHNRKTIMAWSLNTERIIQTEERHTASFHDRLKAAAACETRGYPLAFHFDPMVVYDGCRSDYAKAVDQLFSYISHDRVVWISLGTFRFMPALKSIVQQRFPQSKIPYGEFVPGMDGKMRYFKPVRIELYREVINRIKEKAPNVLVYFCMEDDEVWQKTAGFVPVEKGGLPALLDRRAAAVCGLK